MGCDGGSIPSRIDQVKQKKEPEKVAKEVELHLKWYMCALSEQPLREPVVSCELGRLYNKEVIIEYLLDKSKYSSDSVKHIRGLKDVKVLKLTPNPEAVQLKAEARVQGQYGDTKKSQFLCPISGQNMNGVFKFVYLRPCGCVFSEKALKEVKDTSCALCQTPYTEEDVIVINGSPEEVEVLRTRMEERRSAAKKTKKTKNGDAVENKLENGKTENKRKATSEGEHRSKVQKVATGPVIASSLASVAAAAIAAAAKNSAVAERSKIYDKLFTKGNSKAEPENFSSRGVNRAYV
eukprot:Colp12_sorted_trinity150504_noHs@35865